MTGETQMAPKNKKPLNASDVFKIVGEETEQKPSTVKQIVTAIAAMAGRELKTRGQFKILGLGKIVVKHFPAKKYPAGDYVNRFKKGPDGNPLVEHREARTREARIKIKFNAAKDLKTAVGKA